MSTDRPYRGWSPTDLRELRKKECGARNAGNRQAESAKVHKPNGELYADKHLEEQAAMMKNLRAKGYYADFVQGFEEAATKISAYLLAPTSDLAQNRDLN